MIYVTIYIDGSDLFLFFSNVLSGSVALMVTLQTGMVSISQPEEPEKEADSSEGGHGPADGVRCRAERR